MVMFAVLALSLVGALLVLAAPADAAQYGVKLGFETPGNEMTYVPPTPVTFNLTIEHSGTELVETVIVEILNEPTGWSHNLMADTNGGIASGTTDVEFDLDVGEVARLVVTIAPKEGMDNGTYWLTVWARAKADASADDSLDLGVTITADVDFEIVLWDPPPGTVVKAAPPSTVTVKFAVYNKGNSQDRFRIRVAASMCELGWVPVIVSGVDGLGWTPYLDPDQGKANPHIVTVTLEMPADTLAGTQCTLQANATSESDPSLVRAPAGVTVRATQFHEFQVNIVGPDERTGYVGMTVDFQMRILNRGNGPDTFRIFATWDQEVLPGWFARPMPAEIIIEPFSNDTITYTVQLPMNATMGRAVFHAQIWSSNVDLTSVSKTFYVNVGPHYDMVVWSEETEVRADPGGTVQFDVSVRNTGNVLDSYNVSWVDFDRSWVSYIQPDQVSARPGETAPINVTLRLPQDLGERPLPTYTFDLRVESVLGDVERLLALSVEMRPFGRVEWMWGGEAVTSPAEPVAPAATLRPKPVIDVYNGTTRALSIFLRNAGVIEDNVTFWGRSEDPRVTITVLPEWRVVHVGETVEVFVQISVPDNMFPGEHRVWVNASSSDDRQAGRAVPLEFDVVPYFDTLDFAGLSWEDALEDEFEYTYTMEGNKVVSSRGRRGRHSDLDIVILSAVLDLDSNLVTVTMELKGTPSQDRGVFYGVYFVSEDHQVIGGLEDPKSHARGDFVWESHDEANTTAFMYLSDQHTGSSVPMLSLSIRFESDRVVFTVHAKDLRKAGVDPGSGFRVYGYCHALGTSDGGEDRTRLVYDTAGQGAVTAPWDFTNEPEETSTFMWFGLAVAVVAVLAFLFVVLLPRLMPPPPEEEPDEADDWVEYR